MAARIFNRPETLAQLEFLFYSGEKFDHDMLENILYRMRENGEQIWSGAYVITTHGIKMSKLNYCVDLLEDAAKNFLPVGQFIDQDTCLTHYYWLKKISGLGSFLSAQIVADLKNTPRHPLSQAVDWKTFSAPGPGSLRGLSWYFGTNITTSKYEEAIEIVASELGWSDCMQDLQNCMCEFDKYCRVFSGTGRSKRKYAGLK